MRLSVVSERRNRCLLWYGSRSKSLWHIWMLLSCLPRKLAIKLGKIRMGTAAFCCAGCGAWPHKGRLHEVQLGVFNFGLWIGAHWLDTHEFKLRSFQCGTPVCNLLLSVDESVLTRMRSLFNFYNIYPPVSVNSVHCYIYLGVDNVINIYIVSEPTR